MFGGVRISNPEIVDIVVRNGDSLIFKQIEQRDGMTFIRIKKRHYGRNPESWRQY